MKRLFPADFQILSIVNAQRFRMQQIPSFIDTNLQMRQNASWDGPTESLDTWRGSAEAYEPLKGA